MRTNIDLDDELLAKAQKLSGIQTKKGVVHEALRLYVATQRRKDLSDLRGKIEFAPGYDYKALREDRTEDDQAVLYWAEPLDVASHAALSETLDEWATPEDDEAFRDL